MLQQNRLVLPDGNAGKKRFNTVGVTIAIPMTVGPTGSDNASLSPNDQLQARRDACTFR